jgi:Protein of unknown function (DUF2569)
VTDEFGIQKSGPIGIGGWLICHAIGLTLGPILQGWYAVRLILIFSGNAWTRLTNPDSPAYNFFWKPSLIYEFIGHVFFLCFLIALLILFFSHSRIFPKLVILLFLLYLSFDVGDLLLAQHIPFIVQHSEIIQKQELAVFRSMLICAIWIPYFCVSERVKNTFVD